MGDRVGKAFLVLVAPGVLCWTLYSFVRLATKGTLLVRDHGGVIEVSGGLNFWITLWLYAMLFLGSIVVLWTFFAWLMRKRTPQE